PASLPELESFVPASPATSIGVLPPHAAAVRSTKIAIVRMERAKATRVPRGNARFPAESLRQLVSSVRARREVPSERARREGDDADREPDVRPRELVRDGIDLALRAERRAARSK